MIPEAAVEAAIWDAAQAAHPGGFANHAERDEYLREAAMALAAKATK